MELIDWVNASEPPVTMRLSNEEIGQFRQIPLTLKYPNHTQCVERSVKLVTEASRAVYGFDARDRFIRTEKSLIAAAALHVNYRTKKWGTSSKAGIIFITDSAFRHGLANKY